MARFRRLRVSAILSGLLLGVSGCMIPVYHQPQGFSSTYFRHLQQSAPVLTGAHAASADLAKAPEKQTEEDVSEADQSAEDKEDSTPVTEKSGSWWSWIRRPISSRPVAESDADEDDATEVDEASVPRLDRRY